MTTGSFENFTGRILDIGPLYPFVGMEKIMCVLALVFWIGWHLWQIKLEANEYKEEKEKYVNEEIKKRFANKDEGS